MINQPLIQPYDIKRVGPCSYDIRTKLEKEDKESLYLVSEETFNMPKEYLGIISLRSNAIRRASPVPVTYSLLIDPGFKGKLIFRILKLNYPIGDLVNIFQIMFMKVDGKVEVPYNVRNTSTAVNRQGFKK